MVRIRLRRVGRKKQPSYRIVVADSRSPRDGRYIEIIGFYNPRTQPETMTLQEDRALHWLSVGAQPSESVRRILNKMGTWDRYERLRQGEAVETLVAEAAAVEREPVSPRTQYPAMSKAAKEVLKAARAAEADKAPTLVVDEGAEVEEAASEAAVDESAKAEEAVAEASDEVEEEASEAADEGAEADTE
jgi:small subunit ribosomal protein S16